MTGVSTEQWRGTIGCFNVLRKHFKTHSTGCEPFLLFSKLNDFLYPFKINFLLFLSIIHGVLILFGFSFMVIIMLPCFSIVHLSLCFFLFPHTIPSLSGFSFSLFIVFSLPKSVSFLTKKLLLLTIDMNNCAFFLCVLNILLIMAGIESNPGPISKKNLSFAVWNLDSLPARDYARIPLIESFQAAYNFDIFGICESAHTGDIANDSILIQSFSPDPIRADKADDTRNGGVCLYFREDLPIISRTDLATIPETIVAEIKLKVGV